MRHILERPVLNKGYVKLLNISSPIPRNHTEENPFDARSTDVAKVARHCFGSFNTDRPEQLDLKLIKTLADNNHTSPFEFLQIYMEVKVPFMVARQFHRHRTQAIQEESGRYVTLGCDYYIPNIVRGKAENVKQGSVDNLGKLKQISFNLFLTLFSELAILLYKGAIKLGVANELARMFLPANFYVRYIFSINYHNLRHFLKLRTDSHAQYEARAYANAMIDLLKWHIPDLLKCNELLDKNF